MNTKKEKPHYGYYALPIVISLSAIIIIVGISILILASMMIGIILHGLNF